ncbi:MAG: HAMP domain-containing protein [Chloroflexi bacterium]|nr:HAMP domain-containing protein [Chloroflexota bacterium]
MSAFPPPLRTGVSRALLEAGLGCGAFLLAANAASAGRQDVTSIGAIAFNLLAWFWLICWPAWRLRRVRGRRWWSRAAWGVPRALLMAVALGAMGTALERALWSPPLRELLRTMFDLTPAGPALLAMGFLAARILVLAAAAIGRRVRTRLRWQLLISHVGVMVLTIVTMTAVGSAIVFQFVLFAAQPDLRAMASSVARELEIAHVVSPLQPGSAQRLLARMRSAEIPLDGEPPASGLIGRSLRPSQILLVGPDGRVVAGVYQPTDGPFAAWQDIQSETWPGLRRQALAGRAAAEPLRLANGVVVQDEGLGEAPVVSPSGRVVAVVVLQAGTVYATPVRFFQGTLTIFGVATVLLILATAIPFLALSALFSYVVSRGLTRRLEAVSGVATAIASGDLSQRAPMRDKNEVGRLAANVNRMADHLQQTMGELEDARTRAVGALRARQELVAAISHELRTPLAVIRAHLDTLLTHHPVAAGAAPRESDVSVHVTTLRALQSETERLSGLVEDLFALARAETGGIEVRCEPTDVAALVDETAASMRPLAERAGKIALSVELGPGLPLALADGDRLRQILANLVRNAVRHTPEGGIIALSARAEVGWVVLAVADTGEGIPAEHLPFVFERFYRVDQARTRSGGGAGLGLAIVREFVELMGGRVTVESEPGEGSCFRVFLPRAA